jgi:adenosine kinase
MKKNTGNTILVTGSTAIDQTGTYQGAFDDYQNRYPIEALNMSFQLGNMKTSFGGCGPNMAYGLNLLGADVVPLSSAGRNFRDRYLQHLIDAGVNTDYIMIDDSVETCASCLMINDLHGNQIIGFYPGPDEPKRLSPKELPMISEVSLALLGPEAPELTLSQGRELFELQVPLIVDPGQVIAAFNEDQIRELLELANYLIINEHEHQILLQNAGLSETELLHLVEEVVITRGEQGVDIYRDGARHTIAALADISIIEPTGCGDSFRAGYAYGILNGLTIKHRAQIGCIMAAVNLACEETQRYRTTFAEVESIRQERYS